ncbi:MAG: hypothetical protein ACYTEQ_22630 [Planctomycetota bacterium]|jgi:hypothetical protein
MGGVVDKVKRACFGIDVGGREELHRGVIGNLKKLFAGGGYRVSLEYAIWFESRIRKSGDTIKREGNIDLVAVKNGRKIAIELDTGVHLKFKSIEKLLQADADVCIGIVRGGPNAFEGSVERIEEVREEIGALKKKLWLIVLSERTAHKV